MAEAIKGLAAIRKHQQEQKEKAEAMNRPKADWFKWPDKHTNVAVVRFLQELDESAEGYQEKDGLGFIQVEHQAPGPDGYKRRANCTLETEGQCYACERHSQDRTLGWRQRQNLYINALVAFGTEKPVKVLIQRNANSSFVQALIEEAVDEGSITNHNFKVTRVGEGTTTQWLLKRMSKDTAFDNTGVEVFDLDETAVRKIDYDKQAEYYGAVYKEESVMGSGSDSTRSESSTDAEW